MLLLCHRDEMLIPPYGIPTELMSYGRVNKSSVRDIDIYYVIGMRCLVLRMRKQQPLCHRDQILSHPYEYAVENLSGGPSTPP